MAPVHHTGARPAGGRGHLVYYGYSVELLVHLLSGSQCNRAGVPVADDASADRKRLDWFGGSRSLRFKSTRIGLRFFFSPRHQSALVCDSRVDIPSLSDWPNKELDGPSGCMPTDRIFGRIRPWLAARRTGYSGCHHITCRPIGACFGWLMGTGRNGAYFLLSWHSPRCISHFPRLSCTASTIGRGFSYGLLCRRNTLLAFSFGKQLRHQPR